MSYVPFGFAYVDETETTFNPSTMFVMDENIFAFDLICEENNIPILEITIQNPRVGLLSHGRMVWAWFSYQPPGGSGIVPLFFGVLEAIPSDLVLELITLRFQARSPNFISLKQAAAENLKIRPFYDPVFLKPEERDQPDAIIAGWSSQWNVDPVTLAVTVSDYLIGEDGTAVFAQEDAFYDDFHSTIGEAPLTNVQVHLRVHWTQRSFGYVSLPSTSVASYTGDTVLSGWLQPGEVLGSGWRVEDGYVVDTFKVAQTPQVSVSNSSQNQSLAKNNCDTNSVSVSQSFPALLSPNPITGATSEQGQGSICSPFGNPPIIRGAVVKISGVLVPCWFLTCTATLRYDAKRDYDELAVLDISAETQNVFTSPTFEQDTLLIELNGADVGLPLITYDAWTDFAGKTVEVGDLIFPNDPTTVGGLAYQVCTQGGTAGTTEPEFSDIPGTDTIDNNVIWASMGTAPISSIQRMTFATTYGPGAILCYYTQAFDPNVGDLVDTGETTYYVLPYGGSTTSAYTEETYTPPTADSDEPTPAPVTVFVEAFDPPAGAIAINNPWLGIPIGGTPTNVTANNYFSTPRGNWSLDYGLARGRAVLRKRSRTYDFTFRCPFDNALGVTTRMSLNLSDPRIQGGTATGKIKKIILHGDGGGVFYGEFDVGCAVGTAGTLHPVAGTPDIVRDGSYFAPGYLGYQHWFGAYNALYEGVNGPDISISYPAYAPYDDNLLFPLQSFPGTVTISGTAAAQVGPITAAIAETLTINTLSTKYLYTAEYLKPSVLDGLANVNWIIEELNFYNTSKLLPYTMEANPVSVELLIPPVVNGPFSGAVRPTTTPLLLPMGIDLSAGSSQ